MIRGYHKMGTDSEYFELVRVMPHSLDQPVGQEIKFHRFNYESGHLQIWRKGIDLHDPKYQDPTNN